MHPDTGLKRRKFMAGLAALSMAGLARAAPGEADDRPAPSPAVDPDPARPSDQLLAPGLVYLNTASLGTTPRAVLKRMLQAWRDLEANPVLQAYGQGDTVVMAADRVRGQAAHLINSEHDIDAALAALRAEEGAVRLQRAGEACAPQRRFVRATCRAQSRAPRRCQSA